MGFRDLGEGEGPKSFSTLNPKPWCNMLGLLRMLILILILLLLLMLIPVFILILIRIYTNTNTHTNNYL